MALHVQVSEGFLFPKVVGARSLSSSFVQKWGLEHFSGNASVFVVSELLVTSDLRRLTTGTHRKDPQENIARA